MTRNPLILTLIAAAALAGCNENRTIVAGPPEDNASEVAAEANLTLPPSITSSKIYRCADNDLVYVDWLSDGKSANIRPEKNSPPTQVTAAEAGKPMTAASGYSLTGTPAATTVRIAVPGQAAESCKA